MKSTTDAHQFGQLRARIEAGFSGPAIVVITSASRGDGKTATAFGLAEALADGGSRVLFVDANVDSPILPRFHHVSALGTQPDFSNVSRFAKPVAGQRFLGVSFADERLQAGISLEQIKVASTTMRANFDYVVVDTSPLLQSDLAVFFAAVSDGTLLTLRLGRFPSSADEGTIKTLARVGANTLGVLTVTPALIKTFAARTHEISQVVAPVRHVTTRHTLDADPAREIEPASSNVVS